MTVIINVTGGTTVTLTLPSVGVSPDTQGPQEAIVPCECGCGKSFPFSQMTSLPTEHLPEYYYTPHLRDMIRK